jgi:flagellar basal body-associated protein FliL
MKLSQTQNNRGATHVMLLAAVGALLIVGGLGMYVMNSSKDDKDTKKSQVSKPAETKAETKAPTTQAPVAAAKPTETISVNLDAYMKEDLSADAKDADDYAAAAINDQTTLKNMGDVYDENAL